MSSGAETHRSRRRFLHGAGLGGIVVTVGSVTVPLSGVLNAASAQASGDADIAAFVESVELSLVDAYGVALGKLTTPDVAVAATSFATHHQEHAHALGNAAGRAATGLVNPKLTEMLRPQLARAEGETAVAEILFGLENAAAATHLFALGELERIEARKLAASILPVEAQHAVVLGYVVENEPDQIFVRFETQDQALDPDDYPVAE